MVMVLAAVHIPDVNGIPADDSVNTFSFDGGPAATVADCLSFFDAPLQKFYNDVTVGSTIGEFLAGNIDRGANKCFIEWYQLAGLGVTDRTVTLPLGAPVGRTTFTMHAIVGTTTDLPRECAAVLSLHADLSGLAESVPGGVSGPKGDTHPAARRRGRIYLGPLNSAALGAGTNGPGLAAAFRTAATAAAHDLAHTAAAAGSGDASWCVWSRTTHKLFPITGGFMDDAFDTQRRRGIGASTRTLWTTA